MLAILRIILMLIAFLLINIVVLAVCLVRPFHRDNVHFAGQAYSQMAKILGLKIIIRRSEAVKPRVPYVFIANHQNSYDIITICKAALPGVVTIGKKSLKWIPIFGQIYWLSGNILIDRKNTGRARDTLKVAASKVNEKHASVWLFPEGTRSYGRGVLPFKSGAFRLAKDTAEPVVMVTASNMHGKINWNRWNNGILLIDIAAPQPLTEEHGIKEWTDIFHSRMKAKYEELNLLVAEMEKKQ
ncbi:1-acylglycerol-3-phosphate O-acyltransferase [Alteromonas sp. ASW11-130]|uniref:1-acylglycerol-3-phosphate O-acyltransferase n=1 Tax=Alteromonas sp. ASW11-130 TaxID=3015775 RepID=UPI0022419785|nr:1-acylglycerol-3-phosphate O-acyltransferase [Alteromonas sp. ASW11-130]